MFFHTHGQEHKSSARQATPAQTPTLKTITPHQKAEDYCPLPNPGTQSHSISSKVGKCKTHLEKGNK